MSFKKTSVAIASSLLLSASIAMPGLAMIAESDPGISVTGDGQVTGYFSTNTGDGELTIDGAVATISISAQTDKNGDVTGQFQMSIKEADLEVRGNVIALERILEGPSKGSVVATVEMEDGTIYYVSCKDGETPGPEEDLIEAGYELGAENYVTFVADPSIEGFGFNSGDLKVDFEIAVPETGDPGILGNIGVLPFALAGAAGLAGALAFKRKK